MTSAESIAAKIEKAASNLDDEVEDAVETSTREMEQTAARTLNTNNNVAHGVLLSKLHTTTPRSHQAKYDTVSAVRSGAAHSPFIEYGTGVYNTGDNPINTFKSPDPAPPFGKIYQWVIRKGITPTYSPDGSGVQPSENLIDDQKQIARQIQQTIATYGNKSYPYMRPAYRAHKNDTVGRVADGIRDSFKDFG